MSRENVEAFRRGIEAFNEGDVDGFAATMAPEGRIVPLRAALEDTVYSGPNAAREFWAASMEAWSALHVDIADLRDLGDRVRAAQVADSEMLLEQPVDRNMIGIAPAIVAGQPARLVGGRPGWLMRLRPASAPAAERRSA